MRKEVCFLLLVLFVLFGISDVVSLGGSFRGEEIDDPGVGSFTFSTWDSRNITDHAFNVNYFRNHSSFVNVKLIPSSDETLKIEINIKLNLEEAFLKRPDLPIAYPIRYNVSLYTKGGLDWCSSLPNETCEKNYNYTIKLQEMEALMEINLFTGALGLQYNDENGYSTHSFPSVFDSDQPKSFVEINASTWHVGDELLFGWGRKIGWYQQLYEEKYTVTNSNVYQGADTWIIEVLDILEPYKNTTTSFYNQAEYEKTSGLLIRHDFKEIPEERGDYRSELQSHIFISNISNLDGFSSMVSQQSSLVIPSPNFFATILGMILIYRCKVTQKKEN